MTRLAPWRASSSTMAWPMPLLPPVTMATFPLTLTSCPPWRDAERVPRSLDALEQVVADAERVGHGRQRWVHRADAWKEARVDDVEVVELVRLAVGVEDRRLRVGAEAARAGLVCHAADPDLVLHIEIAWDQMAGIHAEAVQHRLELLVELLFRGLVVERVREVDVPVAVDRDAVVRPRQVIGGRPEVHGMAGEGVERPHRGEPCLERLLPPVHRTLRLAHHLDIAHRVLEA